MTSHRKKTALSRGVGPCTVTNSSRRQDKMQAVVVALDFLTCERSTRIGQRYARLPTNETRCMHRESQGTTGHDRAAKAGLNGWVPIGFLGRDAMLHWLASSNQAASPATSFDHTLPTDNASQPARQPTYRHAITFVRQLHCLPFVILQYQSDQKHPTIKYFQTSSSRRFIARLVSTTSHTPSLVVVVVGCLVQRTLASCKNETKNISPFYNNNNNINTSLVRRRYRSPPHHPPRFRPRQRRTKTLLPRRNSRPHRRRRRHHP